jgi:far upstream element-binding protein
LLLGPRGTFQKRLEEESGCKILIRAQTTPKDTTATPYAEDLDPHVMLISDSFEKVQKAKSLVESIIYCDEATKQ